MEREKLDAIDLFELPLYPDLLEDCAQTLRDFSATRQFVYIRHGHSMSLVRQRTFQAWQSVHSERYFSADRNGEKKGYEWQGEAYGLDFESFLRSQWDPASLEVTPTNREELARLSQSGVADESEKRLLEVLEEDMKSLVERSAMEEFPSKEWDSLSRFAAALSKIDLHSRRELLEKCFEGKEYFAQIDQYECTVQFAIMKVLAELMGKNGAYICGFNERITKYLQHFSKCQAVELVLTDSPIVADDLGLASLASVTGLSVHCSIDSSILARLLKATPFLNRLRLTAGHEWGSHAKAIEHLRGAIAATPLLEDVSLYLRDLRSQNVFEALADSLRRCPLKTLELRAWKGACDQVPSLSALLYELPLLSTLTLQGFLPSAQPIDPGELDLRSLRLEDLDLNVDSVQGLLKLVRAAPKLKRLTLDQVQADDAAFLALMSSLSAPALEELELKDVRLSATALCAFLFAMQANAKKLRHLRVSVIGLDETEARSVVEALSCFTQLKSFKVEFKEEDLAAAAT
jgi:hypothetical protein